MRPRKPSHKHPLSLILWEDPYTLGAFIVKAGLQSYANANLNYLRPHRHSDPRRRLYRAGMEIADSITWKDLSYEIHDLRAHSPGHFDAYIKRTCPKELANTIITTAKSASGSWETEKQIRIGQEICNTRRNHG